MLVGERCDVCGIRARGLCSECRDALDRPESPALGPELDDVVVLFSYNGAGANLLQTLKFRNRRTSVDRLVDAAVGSLNFGEEADGGHLELINTIVPVPPDRRRLRKRGYDLPDLISRRLSTQLAIGRSLCLVRTDSGSQQNRSRSERVAATGFRCTDPIRGSVLLVDDVVTTGATARACALALRLAGANTVRLFVLAATPARRSRVKP